MVYQQKLSQKLHQRLGGDPRLIERRQQRVDHPSVRSRGSRRLGDQAAGGCGVRWARRRGRGAAGAWQSPRRRDF